MFAATLAVFGANVVRVDVGAALALPGLLRFALKARHRGGGGDNGRRVAGKEAARWRTYDLPLRQLACGRAAADCSGIVARSAHARLRARHAATKRTQ